ncbi:MAG: type II toxin-antitoxin system Phd/YefM family antitoxin [Propionibacteriaceae bacterium]|nr:type II toxin-antitoxin system Phd/YefM family antitoxin [Propionibacteriaceae bacterium]
MTRVTSREFNQDVSAAKRAAAQGPVVVTDRGEPAFVLLNIDDYRRLAENDMDEFLARFRMDDNDDIEFAPANLEMRIPEF